MPLDTLRSTLIASAVPARNTNTGAQRWLIQRVKNSNSGKVVPLTYSAAESVELCSLLNAIDAWSMTMSIITKPRIQSIAAIRFDFAIKSPLKKLIVVSW